MAEDETNHSYELRDSDNDTLGIVARSAFPDTPAGWLPYMYIEDFEESLSKVEENGGIIIEKSVTNYQWKGQQFGLIADPSGNRMMLCETKT